MVYISSNGFGEQDKVNLPTSNLIEDIDSDEKYFQVLFVESSTDDFTKQVTHRLCTKTKENFDE